MFCVLGNTLPQESNIEQVEFQYLILKNDIMITVFYTVQYIVIYSICYLLYPSHCDKDQTLTINQ